MAKYVSLEPSYTQALGQSAPTFDTSKAAELGTSLSFLFTLGVMVCVLAGGVMYMRAGAIRLKASEQAIRKSNEEIKRITLGLVGVLSLFVIIYTLNKDLLNVNVGLEKLRVNTSTAGVAPITTTNTQTSGQSASCSDPTTLSSSLKSGGNICAGISCSALSGCSYQQYLPLIQSKAQAAGVDVSLVIAVMCKESKGNVNASHPNPDGTTDCGLMQINQSGSCGSGSLDPATNIEKGIQKLKGALANVQVYPNIPSELGAFASYNCCSNGTVPNAPSVDCTQSAGFPYTLPKWACPINPGSGTYNMCSVKAYACDIEACVVELRQ